MMTTMRRWLLGDRQDLGRIPWTADRYREAEAWTLAYIGYPEEGLRRLPADEAWRVDRERRADQLSGRWLTE